MPKAKHERPWKAYQRIVAEVVSVLDPTASVKEGQWIEGPDGKRDLDVEIRGRVNNRDVLVIIECKDWKAPVGISAVDALDSKRRDVRADFAAICSNSGFTGPALRKSLRKGIGAISAVQKGNSNIKSEVYFQRYQCEINVLEKRVVFLDVNGVKGAIPCESKSIYCLGAPLLNWAAPKIQDIIQEYSHAKRIKTIVTFRKPIQFKFGLVKKMVTGMELFISLNSEWFRKIVKIDATAGIYDYLTKLLRFRGSIDIPVTIGGGLDKGKRIKQEQSLVEFMKVTQGGFQFVLAEINNTVGPIGDGTPVPELESMIERTEIQYE